AGGWLTAEPEPRPEQDGAGEFVVTAYLPITGGAGDAPARPAVDVTAVAATDSPAAAAASASPAASASDAAGPRG
ncbi:hypothetical protein, partial [Clavibacter sp. MX14-G9D]|uniref:hypothetical protein n=1 Tax=Clavibacter sp. MX14-G9D TaxID=3064656 RepID=UPI00293EE8BF